MGVEYGARIFGVELGADKPAMAGDFDDFHQSALRVDADAHHAVLLKLVFVFIVEFVSVAMTLTDEVRGER